MCCSREQTSVVVSDADIGKCLLVTRTRDYNIVRDSSFEENFNKELVCAGGQRRGATCNSANRYLVCNCFADPRTCVTEVLVPCYPGDQMRSSFASRQ